MGKLLNVGCGSRFHKSWVNVDVRKTHEEVIPVDITGSLPFHSKSFEMVYHSHLLEHLPKSSAPDFLLECFRVLENGGIIRVVVPDLEAIVRQYILALNEIRTGSSAWKENYNWIMLEMFDQVVRDKSGGGMSDYLKNDEIPNLDYVKERCGKEIDKILLNYKSSKAESRPESSLGSKIKKLRKIVNLIRPRNIRELILMACLGKEYKALTTGRFRLGGEVHQWMYDSYSLSQLLAKSGFVDIVQRGASESYLENWSAYNLDTEPDGEIYKPDSLFMEARKP